MNEQFASHLSKMFVSQVTDADVAFLPVYKDSSATPFFSNLVPFIIVEKASHAGKNIGWQASFVKSQGRKRSLNN